MFATDNMETIEMDQIYDADTPETLEEALIQYQQPQITIKLQGFQVFINNPHCISAPDFAAEIYRNTEEILSTASDPFVVNTISQGFQQVVYMLPIETIIAYQMLFCEYLKKALASAEQNGFSQSVYLNIISFLTAIEVFISYSFYFPEMSFQNYQQYIQLGNSFFTLFTTSVTIFGEFQQELLCALSTYNQQLMSPHAQVLISFFVCLDDWTLKLLGFPFANSAFAERFTEPTATQIAFSLNASHPLAHASVQLFTFPQFRRYSDEFQLYLVRLSSQSMLNAVLESATFAERILQILHSNALIAKNLDLTTGCCAMLGLNGLYEDYSLISDIISHIAHACVNPELASVLATTYDLFLCRIEQFPSHPYGVKIALKLAEFLESKECAKYHKRPIYRALGSRFLHYFLSEQLAQQTYTYACSCVVNCFKSRCLVVDSVFLLAALRLKVFYGDLLRIVTISDYVRRAYMERGDIKKDVAAELMFNALGDVYDVDLVIQQYSLPGL